MSLRLSPFAESGDLPSLAIDVRSVSGKWNTVTISICPYGHEATDASIVADVLRGAKSGFASGLRFGDTMVMEHR